MSKGHILVITSYLSQGNTGNLLIKALNDLGYTINVLDSKEEPIPKHYPGLTLVWANHLPGKLLKHHRYKVLFYLDSDLFWQKDDPNNSIKEIAPGYDKVYTIVDIEGYEHLPLGCDPEIHKTEPMLPNEKAYFGSDVSFIATNREDGRLKFIEEFVQKINGQFSFKIWGDEWKKSKVARPYWMKRPVYFLEYAAVCSATKIIFQIYYPDYVPHQSNGTKEFEICSIGHPLYMINDTAYKVKEYFPNMPMFKTPDELIELCKYYLNNEEERMKIVKENQEIARRDFSYKKQIRKVLDDIGI